MSMFRHHESGIGAVIRIVAREREVRESLLCSYARDHRVSAARHEVCWIAYDLQLGSNGDIGRALACDSSTPAHCRRAVEQKMRRSPAYREEVEALRDRVILRLRGPVPLEEMDAPREGCPAAIAALLVNHPTPSTAATGRELRMLAAAYLRAVEPKKESTHV